MTQILKLSQLSEDDCVTEVNVSTGWIDPELYPQRAAQREFFSQFILADDLAPCFKDARASSGCMINHRIARRAGALLVFVQQLAHLLDRERRILPV